MLVVAARLNRFLVSQSFYPILLASILAMILYFERVFVSGSWVVYSNLCWNLFLAWIPYCFSMLAALLYRLYPRHWWMLIIPGGLWLLFFPNAPYMITDFFHLEQRSKIPLWYDILLLITFSFTGIFLAIASLKTMQNLVKAYLGRLIGWLFVIFVLGLGGLGIYLGRFERWNSWDLLSHPNIILKNVAVQFFNPSENPRFFGFTLLFTAFLVVCYLMFISMHNMDENQSAIQAGITKTDEDHWK